MGETPKPPFMLAAGYSCGAAVVVGAQLLIDISIFYNYWGEESPQAPLFFGAGIITLILGDIPQTPLVIGGTYPPSPQLKRLQL